MLIRPNLSLKQIEEEISIINTKLDEFAEIGDEISGTGTTVKYNKRYNHFKQKLEELNSMLVQKLNRGK